MDILDTLNHIPMRSFLWIAAFALLLTPIALRSQCTDMAPLQSIPSSVKYAPSNPSLPTIFLVGDSTGVGWGPYFVKFFDTKKVNVVLAAAAGRSSRSYMSEGLWDRVLAQIRPHDIVLIQFGHNDLFAINDPCRARGSIKSIGDETEEIDNQLTHKHEVVHSFGWYLRKYIEDTKAKHAVPVLLSLTPDNVWNGNTMEPDHVGYAAWTSKIAVEEHVAFLDMNAIMSERYARFGQQKTTELFAPHDKTHLTKVGWQLNALWIFEALECLPDKPVDRFLSARGREALPGSSK